MTNLLREIPVAQIQNPGNQRLPVVSIMSMKNIPKTILTLIVGLNACSSLDRFYYLESYGREPMDRHACETPCAYQKTESIRLMYHDKSGDYTVARGPCLFPVYPVDTSFQDNQSINLRVEFRFNEKHEVFVYDEMFNITTDTGQKQRHMGLSFYDNESFYDYISASEYSDELQEKYPVRPISRIEVKYYNIEFGETEWIEVKPKVEVDGKLQALPPIRLSPATSYSYNPFEIPIMYPPVR